MDKLSRYCQRLFGFAVAQVELLSVCQYRPITEQSLYIDEHLYANLSTVSGQSINAVNIFAHWHLRLATALCKT